MNGRTNSSKSNPLPPFRDDLLKAQKMWARANRNHRILIRVFWIFFKLALFSWFFAFMGIAVLLGGSMVVAYTAVLFTAIAVYAIVHAQVIKRNAKKKVRDATKRARD